MAGAKANTKDKNMREREEEDETEDLLQFAPSLLSLSSLLQAKSSFSLSL
jgi:hypothetical protein